MSEHEPGGGENYSEMLTIFLKDVKSYFRTPRKKTTQPGNVFFDLLRTDREKAMAMIYKGFVDRHKNITIEQLTAQRINLDQQIEQLASEMRAETVKAFIDRFENIYYDISPQFPNKDYKKGFVRNEVMEDMSKGEINFIKTYGRQEYETNLLKEFSATGSAVAPSHNIYGLKLENMDFLKPTITQVVDKYIADYKAKYGDESL